MGTHPIFESDFDCLTDMETVTINRLPCRIEETNESVDMARFEKTFRMKDGQQSAIFQGRPLRATEYKDGNIILAKQDGEDFKEVAKVDKLVSWRLHPVHEKEPLDHLLYVLPDVLAAVHDTE